MLQTFKDKEDRSVLTGEMRMGCFKTLFRTVCLFGIKGAMSRYLSIFLKSQKVSWHQLNSKNKGLTLLLKTILRHCNCFLPSVATDGKDGNGLKLEKIGPIFSSSDAMFSKLTKKNMVSYP